MNDDQTARFVARGDITRFRNGHLHISQMMMKTAQLLFLTISCFIISKRLPTGEQSFWEITIMSSVSHSLSLWLFQARVEPRSSQR